MIEFGGASRGFSLALCRMNWIYRLGLSESKRDKSFCRNDEARDERALDDEALLQDNCQLALGD